MRVLCAELVCGLFRTMGRADDHADGKGAAGGVINSRLDGHAESRRGVGVEQLVPAQHLEETRLLGPGAV